MTTLLESDSEWRGASTNLALVAEIEDEVVGYLEASVQPPLESAQGNLDLGRTRLFVNYVEVGRAHQRQGVGTRLVEAAEEWGRTNGATIAVCDTWIESPVSVPFWVDRMGYSSRAIRLRKSLVAVRSG